MPRYVIAWSAPTEYICSVEADTEAQAVELFEEGNFEPISEPTTWPDWAIPDMSYAEINAMKEQS